MLSTLAARNLVVYREGSYPHCTIHNSAEYLRCDVGLEERQILTQLSLCYSIVYGFIGALW